MINGKYFYFRFKTDFFLSENIRGLKEIPVVGYKYIVIYLELCSLAIENGGILKIRTFGEVYYTSQLAKHIGETVEDISIALSIFLKNGLVEKYDEDEFVKLHIPYVMNNTGKGSKDADRKRLEYTNQKLLENNLENNNLQLEDKKVYGILKNIMLTEKDYEELDYYVGNKLDYLINEASLKKKRLKNIEVTDYELILECYRKREN